MTGPREQSGPKRPWPRRLHAWAATAALGLSVMAAGAHAAGYPELAAAIRAGDAAAVQGLLAQGVDPSASEGQAAAPILIAASRGKHDIARALLAKGANRDVRYAAYYDATPLMLAINNRDLAMARLLVEAGAAVDLVDRNGDPAINWACFYGDLPAVNLLLAHGARTTQVGHGDALQVSMRRGHQPLVQRLLEHRGERRALAAAEQRLVAAIDRDDAEGLRAALRDGADPSARDDTHRSVLARAARQGRDALVALLLEAGAAPDAADAIGFTPLFEAARDGRLAAAELLIRGGADVNRAALPAGLAMTPLHAAAGAGRGEMVALLARHGARLDARDAEQATPLAWAINAEGDAALRLASLGADPDLAPQGGSSPRQLAEQRGLKALLAAMRPARPS